MKWFKHQVNASEDDKLNVLFDNYKHTGLAFWWMFVELCYQDLPDTGTPKYRYHLGTVARRLRSSPNKVKGWLQQCSDLGMIKLNFDDKMCEIEFPKLLEYLPKDSKYNRKTVAKKSLHNNTTDNSTGDNTTVDNTNIQTDKKVVSELVSNSNKDSSNLLGKVVWDDKVGLTLEEELKRDLIKIYGQDLLDSCAYRFVEKLKSGFKPNSTYEAYFRGILDRQQQQVMSKLV